MPPRRPLQLFTLPASQCRPRKQDSGRDGAVPHDSVCGWSRARAESHRQVFDAVGGPTRRKLTTHVSAENDRGMWVPDDRLVEMNYSQSLPIDTRGNDSRPVMGVPREDHPGIFQKSVRLVAQEEGQQTSGRNDNCGSACGSNMRPACAWIISVLGGPALAHPSNIRATRVDNPWFAPAA